MQPWALITGSARRVGAAIAAHLAQNGVRVILHCSTSRAQADNLAHSLANLPPPPVLQADLADPTQTQQLAIDVIRITNGRLWLLVNNAAIYLPDSPIPASPPTTPTPDPDPIHARKLFEAHASVNAGAAYQLALDLRPALEATQGSIINLLDICIERPWKNFAAYSASKAALASLTLSLARQFAPAVRSNGICIGVADWPDNASPAFQQAYLARTPLQRPGSPDDIAHAVLALARQTYITGALLPVDGGRRLT